MKRIILHGAVAGLLAAFAGIIYCTIYQKAMGTDFKKIINTGSITGSSMLGCLLMAAGYGVLLKLNWQKATRWLNLLIVILSFSSILGPISMSLPLDISSPELFPGLAVPMHFFPALSFFCLAPFFSDPRNIQGIL